MKTEALLIIDMLNDFVLQGAPLEVPDSRKTVPVIRNEIDRAHTLGNPVIFLCDAHEPDDKEFRKFNWPPHAVKGTTGAEVIDELKPAAEDIIIRKNSYSGFFGTTLGETLARLGVGSIRFTGVVTNVCIMFIGYEAVLRDYEITVIENGVAALNQEDHEDALRIMKRVLGAKVIKTGLEEPGKKAA